MNASARWTILSSSFHGIIEQMMVTQHDNATHDQSTELGAPNHKFFHALFSCIGFIPGGEEFQTWIKRIIPSRSKSIPCHFVIGLISPPWFETRSFLAFPHLESIHESRGVESVLVSCCTYHAQLFWLNPCLTKQENKIITWSITGMEWILTYATEQGLGLL